MFCKQNYILCYLMLSFSMIYRERQGASIEAPCRLGSYLP